MEASEYLATVETIHGEARARGLFFQHASDSGLSGRRVTVRAQELLSFASCSYLGLERHPALVRGVHDAVERFGTQFSSSRGYLSAPLYAELEALLGSVFERHALVSASTTLAHMTALPVLATERDAIVLDHQAHHSMQAAATIARAGGARVEVVKHGELDRAEEVVTRLARTCRTVWFACDGVYSMYGDLAPVALLRRMLDAAPNVRLYVDDAHGMSWAGRHGRGSFLSRMCDDARIVVVTSLNKAFSAAGGCLLFVDDAERERVRTTGGPMVFSGPLQPPMLGAAVASAHIHLGDEIGALQRALRERADRCNARMREHGLPLLSENESPIFFVELGLPAVAFDVAERMMREGVYVCVSAYPSVPMKRAGIRLTLTAAHTFDEVDHVVARLATHVPEVLRAHGLTEHEVAAMWADALPFESRPHCPIRGARLLAGLFGDAAESATLTTLPVAAPPRDAAGLDVLVAHTIEDVDREAWDAEMGTQGAIGWDAMRLAERVFAGRAEREHAWTFLYVLVRDAARRTIGAALFTTALCKDDMLMRHEVSVAVEKRRVEDPYFLTSRAVMMGSLLSEGRHYHLDRSGPWRAAMSRILEVATREYERTGAGVLLLRDMPADDPEMDELMLQQGLVKAPMLDSHVVDLAADTADYEARLSRRQRRHLRQNQERAQSYTRTLHGVGHADPIAAAELEHLYALYRNVARKNLRLNVFALPADLLSAMLGCPAWEMVTLRLDPRAGGPADGRPVAFFAAYRHAHVYAPFFCGLDYRYVIEHGAYRQLLYQIMVRAREVGARELRLGMGADMEKDRFGTTHVRAVVYVQARDDYGGALLREIAAEVAMGAAS
jgi:7-keto-8-aminopelargonate synthetase-like enzyme